MLYFIRKCKTRITELLYHESLGLSVENQFCPP